MILGSLEKISFINSNVIFLAFIPREKLIRNRRNVYIAIEEKHGKEFAASVKAIVDY